VLQIYLWFDAILALSAKHISPLASSVMAAFVALATDFGIEGHFRPANAFSREPSGI
jgi:hypothetical protein